MNLIVDLHVHSKFSRATSKRMDLSGMYYWGKLKGINIIGTGDFTHPGWFEELATKLEPAEDGLFALKSAFANKEDQNLPASVKDNLLRFILTVEISTIYKKKNKVRKLHQVIVVKDLKTAAKINGQLNKIGNLKADGRPILGLDSKELLKITLDSDSSSLFIPAHIWTPWFSVFGSKSGFDSLVEAYDELNTEIKAVETGLSSDPAMNWRIKQLDHLTLVSHSDAHSPEKLGREANILNCQLNYKDIIGAITTGDKRFVGTIEFFPQEGKYHFDGHKNCGICLSPAESLKLAGICPKCHQPLTLGVDYRVNQLASRPEGYTPKHHKQVDYIIPLMEIIAQFKNSHSVNNQSVKKIYFELISQLADEFNILRQLPILTIKEAGYTKLARLIDNLRKGKILVQPGFDGVYGVIKIISQSDEEQMKLL